MSKKNNANVTGSTPATTPAEATPVAAPTPAPAVSTPSAWDAYISPFAQAIGKSPAEVTAALNPLVGEGNDEAIALLQNAEDTSDADIKNVLGRLGVPTAKLGRAIRGLRAAAPATVTESAPAMSNVLNSILPAVPDEGSFTEMLRTGGTLKVDQLAVISGIRVTLAEAKGIFGLPKILASRMESHAEELEGEINPKVFDFLDMLAARDYAEVLRVIKVSSRFVTEARKNAFFKKSPAVLSALQRFHEQLQAFAASVNQGGNMMMTPAALIQAMQAMASGNRASMAFMNTTPNTTPLRAAAEAVNNKINQAFAGFGVPVARALAYEAGKIKTLLMDPTLPALLGEPNREQMLKSLGMNVSSDYPLLENNVVQYALGVIQFPEVPSGDQEIMFLSALFNLGNAIQWNLLKDNPKGASNEEPTEDHRYPGRRDSRL